MFKATEEGTQPQNSNFLMVPYCGPVTPVEFERKKVGSVEDCFVATVKLLGQDYEGNDVAGITEEYVEWNPTQKDQEKQQKAADRLNYFSQHLLDHAMSKEQVLAIEGDTWEEYVDNIIKALKQHNATERDDIQMKFVGSVYQGEPKIDIPRYLNFVANQNSDEDLTWKNNEHDDNKKYLKARNSTPDDPEDVGEGDDLEDQSF